MTASTSGKREFTRSSLRRHDLVSSPLVQLQLWLDDATATNSLDPYAMTLATVQRDGTPAARTVILKRIDERGLVFTTSTSPKTRDLAATPHAAVVFYWPELERQVRAAGRTEVLTAEEAAALYANRTHAQRLALLTFPQSEPIASRAALDARFGLLEQRYAGREVSMPDHWRAWCILPSMVEFWQGGKNRLHDRLRYLLTNDGWKMQRLAP